MTTPQAGSSSVKKPSRWPWIVALVVVAGFLFWLYGGQEPPSDRQRAAPPQGSKEASAPSQTPASPPSTVTKTLVPAPPPPSSQGPVVEVKPDAQSQTSPAAQEQAQRKKPFGLDKSLDAVVRSDETIQVGDQKVKVAELERKLVVEQQKRILDKPLGPKEKQVSAWGVYLVRPGDNLWRIHYALLREYMRSKGVALPPHSDQPNHQGRSSGVGKILKFAEHMVGVYNLETGKMSHNLNLLEPGEKVVVFNLSEIFGQLAKIDPHDLSGVMYDGRVLIFPQGKKLGPPGQ